MCAYSSYAAGPWLWLGSAGTDVCKYVGLANATVTAAPKSTTEIPRGLWGHERKAGPFWPNSCAPSTLISSSAAKRLYKLAQPSGIHHVWQVRGELKLVMATSITAPSDLSTIDRHKEGAQNLSLQ